MCELQWATPRCGSPSSKIPSVELEQHILLPLHLLLLTAKNFCCQLPQYEAEHKVQAKE